MAKKYLQNEKGIVRATTTDSLQLEKPLLNEHYDINVHNRNMDKLDTTIQRLKSDIDSIDVTIQNLEDRVDNVGSVVEKLELKAEKVTLADKSNLFAATNVEDALLENRNKIASNTSNIASNTNLINSLSQEVNGQRLRGINIANAIIDKLEG